ncbi:MAG: TetR/AcrR family transcriptional regulator [Actinoallomurus sp.]
MHDGVEAVPELGVQAPALYRHFADKEDLLRATADTMFDPEMAVLDRPGPGWSGTAG